MPSTVRALRLSSEQGSLLQRLMGELDSAQQGCCVVSGVPLPWSKRTWGEPVPGWVPGLLLGEGLSKEEVLEP